MEQTGVTRARVREYMDCFAREAANCIASLRPRQGPVQRRRARLQDLFRYSVERSG